MVEEHRQRADQVALLDADNQLASLSTNLETQTLSRHGKDALAAGADVQDQWKTGTSQIEAGLTNDNQRENFRIRADHHWQSLNDTVQKHGASEFQKYDLENTNAALSNRLDSAVKHYTDPTIVGQSLAESKDLVDLYANRNGWSLEQIGEKKTQVVSSIHTGVIDHMLTDGNDLTAQSYFTAHKDELTAENTLQVSKALDVGSRRGESQRQADKIIQTTSTLTDAVAAARAIQDPEVRDLTESRVRNDFAERSAAMRDAREQAMQGATNIIERTHDFNSIPPSLVASMTVGERASLRNYAEKLAGGGAVKTDLSAWYDLQRMATTPETSDKFLQLDLNRYKSKLSASDFEEMAKLQSSVRKGEDKPLAELYSRQQTVGRVLTSIGIGVDSRRRKDEEPIIADFQKAVNQQVDLFQESTGKRATTTDVERIANELAAQHVVERPGRWWGTNREDVRTFQMMSGEQIIGMTIKDVPAQAKAQIQQALRERHKAVTDQAIVDAYRTYVQTLPAQ